MLWFASLLPFLFALCFVMFPFFLLPIHIFVLRLCCVSVSLLTSSVDLFGADSSLLYMCALGCSLIAYCFTSSSTSMMHMGTTAAVISLFYFFSLACS